MGNGDTRIRRRDFVGLIGTVAAWPKTVFGEAAKKRPLIGRLLLSTPDNPSTVRYMGDFFTGMRELGYNEGRDFDMVYRSANFDPNRFPQAAAEMVALAPDVILAAATIDAVAAKKATTTIPIVVGALAEPVELGFASSNARPTGNVTGITPYVKGLPAKQVELARELVSGATRIGLVDDVTDPKAHPQRQEIEAAGRSLEIKIVPAEVRSAADIEGAFGALATAGVDVVVVEQSTMLLIARVTVAEQAAAKKLPAVYGYREYVEVGGLISYGVNLDWCFHRTAYYVDKILKGTKPSDLPIEFPDTLDMGVNLKTARALGLTIPKTILIRADKLIE